MKKWHYVISAAITFVLFLGVFILVAIYRAAIERLYTDPVTNVTPLIK
jgi:hypothetical protein